MHQYIANQSLNQTSDDANSEACIGTFSFGQRFYYSRGRNNIDNYDDHIIVHPKYSSLKEELLNNSIFTINRKQYDMDCDKGLKHYNSDFCKSKYQPCINYSVNSTKHTMIT